MLLNRYMWLLLLIFLIMNTVLRTSYAINTKFLTSDTVDDFFLSFVPIGFFLQFCVAIVADNTIGRFAAICGIFGVFVLELVVDLLRTLSSGHTTQYLAYTSLLLIPFIFSSSTLYFLTFIADQLPKCIRAEQRERLFGVVLAAMHITDLCVNATLAIAGNVSPWIVPVGSLVIVVVCGLAFWLTRHMQNPDSLNLERGLAWKAVLMYFEAVRQCFYDVRKQKILTEDFDEQSLTFEKKPKDKEQNEDKWEYTQTFLDRAAAARFDPAFVACIYHMQQLSYVCVFLSECWVLFYCFSDMVVDLKTYPIVGSFCIPHDAVRLLQTVLTSVLCISLPFVFFPLVRRFTKIYFHHLNKLSLANVAGFFACIFFFFVWSAIEAERPTATLPDTVDVGFVLTKPAFSQATHCRLRLSSKITKEEILISLDNGFLTGYRFRPGQYKLSMDAHSRHCRLPPGRKRIEILPEKKYQCFAFHLWNGVLWMQPTVFNEPSETMIALTTCHKNLCVNYKGEHVSLPTVLPVKPTIFDDLNINLPVLHCINTSEKTLLPLNVDLRDVYGSEVVISVFSNKSCDSQLTDKDKMEYTLYRAKSKRTVHEFYKLPIIFLHSFSEALLWVYGAELMYGQSMPALRMLSVSIFGFANLCGAMITKWLKQSALNSGEQMLVHAAVFAVCAAFLYYIDIGFDYMHTSKKRRNDDARPPVAKANTNAKPPPPSSPMPSTPMNSEVRVRRRRTVEHIAQLLGRPDLGRKPSADPLDAPPEPVVLSA